jgi:thioredoxin reductase (NADPH)
MPQAVEYLKAEHLRIENLLKQIELETHSLRSHEIFKELRAELELHFEAEESVLYPVLLSDPVTDPLVKPKIDTSLDEHQEIKAILVEVINQIGHIGHTGRIGPQQNPNEFDNRLNELIRLVRLHFKKEESDIYPRLQGRLTPKELAVLGRKLQEAKGSPDIIASRSNTLYDCAVIGGGPGGLVTSLYLRRFRRSVALIEFGKPRAAWIPRTHNLMGYDRGISGKLLLRRLNRQLNHVGIDRFKAKARIYLEPEGGFRIELGRKRFLRSKTVVLATGLIDEEPKLENLQELREKGLLRYCSICDGYEYRNEPIAILAQDDAGIQKGLFIAHWSKDIRFILPETLRLAPQRVQELEAIHAKLSRCRVLKVHARGQDDRDGIDLYLDERDPVYARAAYVELGCRVNDSAYAHLPQLKRTKEGFITTTTEQRTSIPGLFAVGDCVNLLGQISVAAGQAAVAATTIHNDLLAQHAQPSRSAA